MPSKETPEFHWKEIVSIMESILVLTHADEAGAALTRASLEAVTAGQELAAQLSASLAIGIVAADAAAPAAYLAESGARLYAVSGETFREARYSTDAAACEALCRAAEPSIVLAPSCSRFARVAAGVAHRLGGAIDTHITAVKPAHAGDAVEVSRWFYRQRIEAELSRDTRPWFLLIETGTYAPFAGTPGSAAVESVSVELPPLRTQVKGMRTPGQNGTSGDGSPQFNGQTIRPDAKMLFVAGAGWTKKQPDGQVHVEEAGRLILRSFAGRALLWAAASRSWTRAVTGSRFSRF